MAEKRKIVVEKKAAAEKPEEPPQEMGWRDWLLRRYAIYWYWIVVAFLDIVILLETPRSLGIDQITAGGLTALAVAIEVIVYLMVWGKKGPLGPLQ